MAKETRTYGILIRHNGFIDRYVRQELRQPYTEADIDAWITSDPDKAATFHDPGKARAMAEKLNGRFGPRYRFDLLERRMVPRWFLLEPRDEREERPVGSYEQL
jgi:hypothetical protein